MTFCLRAQNFCQLVPISKVSQFGCEPGKNWGILQRPQSVECRMESMHSRWCRRGKHNVCGQ